MRPSVAEMSPVEQAGYARELVLRRLADRARSRADLARTLAGKQVPAEVAAAMLDKFEAAGLIDDADFARQWVQSRQRAKGLARSVLARELRRHGVDEESARAALAQLDPDTERAAAHDLVRRRLPGMRGLAPHVQTRRLVGMLARKGYPAPMAVDVVRQVLGGEPPALDSC